MPTGRDLPAQFRPPLAHVAHFRAVRRRPVVGHVLEFLVADGNGETVAEGLEAVHVQLLQGVGFVVGLPRLAGAVAFHRHGQDDRGALLLLHRLGVGGIDLVGVVATAIQVHDVFVRQVFHQLQQLRVLAEKMFAGIGAAVVLVVLQLTVADLVHALLQQAGLVALQQGVPLAAPDHLDHVPAGAPKHPLQFLDDLAVAAHRPIQALQVAVHHEVQVAQPLTTGQGNSAQ